MADRYSWQESKSEPSYRSSNQDHLGWWAAAAMLVSVLLHVIVFFALDQVKFALGIQDQGIRETQPIVIREQTEEVAYQPIPDSPPDDYVPPPDFKGKLMDDIDIQQALKDKEIDIKPAIDQAVYELEMRKPLASGDPEGITLNADTGLSALTELPDPGRTESSRIQLPEPGQITVDPGSSKGDDTDLTRFTQEVLKKGGGGKAERGSLDGVADLEDLIGLDANALMGKKTMLPSDFLFEFNKAELRESAKFGLNKLGMLLDLNPEMYCWIEGYTDLIGSDAANLELSKKRAEAVKEYLVKSMKMDAGKIITRGFGEMNPIIIAGDKDQQSPNRRVEIKMRKTQPAEEQIKIVPTPPRAEAVEEMPPARPIPVQEQATKIPEAAPPKATLVRPNPERGIPVEVVEMPPQRVPKATPIAEPPPITIPKALPIEPEKTPPARAIPVVPEAEPVLRAQPVPE